MNNFYTELPKAELHLHLEGSVEPETLLELDPALTPEDVRDIYVYSDFVGFLQSYAWVSKKLTRPEHYATITKRLLEGLLAQSVPYVEINLSVGVILWKEQDFTHIYQAVREAAEQSPVEVHWIFDAVRQFGAEAAMRVAELAVRHAKDGVIGFGIGGDELRGPAEVFGEVFAYTRKHGLVSLPHAGEIDGPQSVWGALELGARRIGHGIRSIEDPVLVRHLRDHNIPLEICISSNICTGAVATLAGHPVRRLYDAGVPIILNSDDPAMFHTSISKEYRIAEETFGFSREELSALAAFSFTYAASAMET